jgi:hypothetical protein
MVPPSYHSFFSDAAQVAGTLIGLLFVAVSLAPERLGENDADFPVKAGIAFAALVNALVIGLIALLPGDDLAITSTVLASGGISSTIGLGAISFRHANLGRRFRALFRVAVLIIAGFVFAVERAWELVGASGSGMFTTFAGLLNERRGPTREATPTSAAPSPPNDRESRYEKTT